MQYRFVFGTAEYDEGLSRLTVNGVTVPLEPKSAEALSLLLRQSPETVTHNEFFDQIWQAADVKPDALTTQISRVRTALGNSLRGRIVTLPRVGYRFEGPVERVEVGNRFADPMRLEPDAPAPGRAGYILKKCLSSNDGRHVWVASDADSGDIRVLKYGTTEKAVYSLKREVSLSAALSSAYDNRADFVQTLYWRLDEAPCLIEAGFAGVDLHGWEEKHGSLADVDLDKRRALAVGIARTIHDAHRIGVFHGDIKPSNVLIADLSDGADWTAALTDFGVGGVFDAGLFDPYAGEKMGLTRELSAQSTGGTAAYIAPEVFNGEPPGARSDIFSLGLLTYQLLVGDLTATLTPGWEKRLPDPLIREDIERATQNDPGDRFASAEDFAKSLESLEHRHVLRSQQEDHAEKLSALQAANDRNRARRPWVMAAIGSLVLGLVTTTYMGAEARKNRDAALYEAQRANATVEFLSNVISGADPRSTSGAADPALQQSIKRAFEDLEENFDGDVETRLFIAEKIKNAADGIFDTDLRLKSQRLFAQDTALLLGASSREAIAASIALAEAHILQSQFQEASEILVETDRRLSTLKDKDEDLSLRLRLQQGTLSLMTFDFEAAAEAYEGALALMAELEAPSNQSWFGAKQNLAQAYTSLGRVDEALGVLRQLVVEVRQFDEPVPPHRRANARMILGATLIQSGNHSEAVTSLTKSVDEMADVYGPENIRVGITQSYLGQAEMKLCQWDKASLSLSAAETSVCAFGETMQCAVAAIYGGIVALHAQEDTGAALQLNGAKAMLDRILPPEHPLHDYTDFHRALAMVHSGELTNAEKVMAAVDLDRLGAAEAGQDWAAAMNAIEALLAVRSGDRGAQAALDVAIEKLAMGGEPACQLEIYRAR